MMWLWLIIAALAVSGWLFWKSLVYPEDAVELQWDSSYVRVRLAADPADAATYPRMSRYVDADGWFFEQRMAWAYRSLVRARERQERREARVQALRERRGE